MADSQQSACPSGYDLGALTFKQVLRQGLYQEQLDAGVTTKEAMAAGFANRDVNANGVLCFKSWGHIFEHPYLIIDDPGGNPG